MSGPALIGAITIGQSPRPDLVLPLRSRLPTDVAIIEIGALDDLDEVDLPGPAHDGYPLTTRLRSGALVTVDDAFLAPRVQAAVEQAERVGCSVSLLLCAGGFADLRSDRPLVRPFELAAAALRSLGLERIVVVVPIDGQVAPAARKWRAAGFVPTVLAARLGEAPKVVADALPDQPVVLDFVGHPPGAVAHVRELVGRVVVDPADLAAATLAAMMTSGTPR